MLALHEMLESTAGHEVLSADRLLLAQEGVAIGRAYFDSIGVPHETELRSAGENEAPFPVLVLKSSSDSIAGRYIGFAQRRFPNLKVVFAPTYMIDGFSAAMFGPNELVIAMPLLAIAPERGLGILLHELLHRKNHGRVGWFRADKMEMPSVVKEIAGKPLEWQYPRHQSADEPQAYSLSFRISFKKMRVAIREGDAELVAGHWAELNQTSRTIVETLGRNIWAAETLLKNWRRRQQLYDPLSEDLVSAHSFLTFKNRGSLIATWPIAGKPGDPGQEAALKAIYQQNLVRDRALLVKWVQIAEELAAIQKEGSLKKSAHQADRIWGLFTAR